MTTRLKEVVAALLCHRTAYGALALLYAAASAGAWKEAVGWAAAGCYLLLCVRG